MRWDQIEGWFSQFDATFVSDACNKIHNGLIVEVGFFAGRCTSIMAPICRKNNSVFHTIDNCQGADIKDPATKAQRKRDMRSVFDKNMKIMGLSEYIIVHQMDGAKAAQLFDEESVDFCFLDASHVAADVQKDIDAWWPTIKKGGFLGGHDYQWDSVRGVVNGFAAIYDKKAKLSKDKQCWLIRK